MGKKRGNKNPSNGPNLPHRSISLRQEITCKTQTKGGARNPKSFLKLDHLQKLAVWASGEASIPSLASFYGRQFAATAELLEVNPDPSLLSCQRCETILQSGFNCTVRIEKSSAKARRKHNRHSTSIQNNVVYKCQFCSYRNLKRGTLKGHMKDLCPSKAKQKPSAKSNPPKNILQKCASVENVTAGKDQVANMDVIALPSVSGENSITDSPATPSARIGTTLLEAKKRKRNRSNSKKSEESKSGNAATSDERPVGASSKRRKSWMSLKKIAESNEHDITRNVTNLTIPFFF